MLKQVESRCGRVGLLPALLLYMMYITNLIRQYFKFWFKRVKWPVGKFGGGKHMIILRGAREFQGARGSLPPEIYPELT